VLKTVSRDRTPRRPEGWDGKAGERIVHTLAHHASALEADAMQQPMMVET
jgi:hypothetical protein